MSKRISRVNLEDLARKLSECSREILCSLRRYKYMTTHQLRRLHFTNCVSDLAALRASNRALSRLRKVGIISPLARRIGGVRAGSGSYVWTLAPAGARLLAILERSEGERPRKHRFEPSAAFLEHTLAVTEVAVRLTELARGGKITLQALMNEPSCWRAYAGIGGAVKYLKPDLSAVTAAGDYEDHWFFELDLATEAPSVIMKKCMQYLSYRNTGNEQRKSGVFPSVVWITPECKRKESIEKHLQKEFYPPAAAIFLIITLDELEQLVVCGAERFKKERGTNEQ